MVPIIHYAGLCLQGKGRLQNEDNLWCNGVLRLPGQADLPIFTGSVRPGPDAGFCVADGVSGLRNGETASWLAAGSFGQVSAFDRDPSPRAAAFLCRDINRQVLSYHRSQKGHSMGTTIASLYFASRGIFGFNVGDSRCYRSSGGILFQMSRDHRLIVPGSGRPCLTQYLGLPEESFLLEPFFYQASYLQGDRYLLCTNGLGRYAGRQAVSYILRQDQSPKMLLAKLQDLVETYGQSDDLTMILFSID